MSFANGPQPAGVSQETGWVARLAHFTDKVRAELQVRHMWEAVVLIVLRVLRVDFAVQIVRANVWRKHSAASVQARQRQRGDREHRPFGHI